MVSLQRKGPAMQRALRLLLVLSLCFGFAGALQPGARAQEAAGSPVEIIGADGEVLATVTVDGIAEPFEDYDSGYEPDRGMHYALVTLTITNESDEDFAFDSYSLKATDSDGFVADSAWVTRSASDTAPDFDGSPIPAGETVTGAAAFSVFDGATLDLVFYQPSFTRMAIFSEQAEMVPAPGDAVETLTSDGNEGLVITVDEVNDEVDGVYAGYEAQRGYYYVQTIITVENPTGRPIDINTGMFGLVDEEGYYIPAYSVYFDETPEIEELSYDPVPGGESVTAALYFQVYNGAEPARLVFSPSYYEQVFTVALFDDGMRGPIAPAGAPAGGGASGGTAGADVDPACADVEDWLLRSEDMMNEWSDALDAADMPEDVNSADPAVLRELADTTRDFMDDMDADPAPDLAVDYEDTVYAVLELFADSLDEIADAIENGEDALPLFEDFAAEAEVLTEDLVVEADALATACNF
jgi:hypothetical protein